MNSYSGPNKRIPYSQRNVNPQMSLMNSCSTGEISPQTSLIFCHCGMESPLRTSWIPKNPGRRFRDCPGVQGKRCSFSEWYDPEMCNRSTQIIPGLLKKIDIQDVIIASLNRRCRKLMFALVVS